MTVVAGLADGGRVWMGCDSLTVDAWDLKGQIESKIVRRVTSDGDEVLLGVSGDAQLLPLLRYELDLPSTAGDVDEWAWRVACAITTLMVEATPDLMREKAQNASVLLGFGGALWSCATNQAWPAGRFMAIGSGDNLALGAFHALEVVGALDEDPARAVAVAVGAGSRFDLHCGGQVRLEVLG